MKKVIIIFLVIASCHKPHPTLPPGRVTIFYKNNLGNSLFNTNNYLRANVSRSILYKSSLYPFQNFAWENYWIPDSSLAIADLANNGLDSNDYVTYLINLKQGVQDTLVGHIKSGYPYFDSIWYNGKMKPILPTSVADDTFSIVKYN
jgi:hypothetical protein